MRISKRWRAVAGLLVAGLLAAGCGDDSNNDGAGSAGSGDGSATTTAAGAAQGAPAAADAAPVSIVLQSYMPVLGDIGTQTLEGLVSGFEAQHPNIDVEIRADTEAGAAALSATYQREAAADDLPDVGQVVFDTMRFAVSGLGAKNLDDVVGKPAIEELFSGPHPYAAPVTKLAEVDGQMYGIPWTLSTPVLFYNPTLFETAGLDPAKPPSTWDEVHEASKAINAATGASGIQVACVGVGASGNDWCLQAIFSSNGGGVMADDGATTTFDRPENVEAVAKLRDLAADGSMVDLTLAQTVEQFTTGKLAMILTSAALQGTLLKGIGETFELKNTGMPGFAGHAVTPTNSGSALIMFADEPAKQEAAWTLMQWLTSPESLTTITSNVGYPPLRPSLAEDAAFLKPFADEHPLLAANLAQLEKLIPWQSYPGPNFLQIETLVLDAASKAIFQGEDPASSMEGAQSQAEDLVQ